MILSCFNWFDQRRQIILPLIEAGPQAVTITAEELKLDRRVVVLKGRDLFQQPRSHGRFHQPQVNRPTQPR